MFFNSSVGRKRIMDLLTEAFVEHRTIGEAFGAYGGKLRPNFVVPGASSCCNGTTSSSCCCIKTGGGPKKQVKKSFDQAASVQVIKTFEQATSVFGPELPPRRS
jgi:hypothetical protein